MEKAERDVCHPLQADAWRRMGGVGRSEMAASLRRRVRDWKTSALRQQHPDWSEERLQRELAAIYLRATT